MGEHLFGYGPGHLPRRADKIAAEHGARLVNYTLPRGEKVHWFTCPNMGAPFDGATAEAVLDDLRKAGLISNERNERP